MKTVEFYWLPTCSTCQKAKNYLESNGFVINSLRDIKGERLSLEEIQNLTEKVGSVGEMFSRRAIKYREMKLNERTLDEKEMLDLMFSDYTFLKRPILVLENMAICGFSEKQYQKLSEIK